MRLFQGMTINEYVSLFHAYMLTGKADDSLDAVHVGLTRFTEHYRIAPGWRGKAVCQAVHQEMLPDLRRYTDRFSLGDDDLDGDGVSNNGRELAHEYDLVDYESFLEASRAQPRVSGELVLLCRGVPDPGLALVEFDLTALARRLDVLPLTFSRLRASLSGTVAALDSQFIPDPDFDPHLNVRGRALFRFPRGGEYRVRLDLGAGNDAMPTPWDGVVRGPGYTVTHDLETGGLPRRIAFDESGRAYDTFAFNDRLHSRDKGGFHLRHEPVPRVDKLGGGPLATVVRVQARYTQGAQRPSAAEAVYDWIYLRDTPVVMVEARISQEHAQAWDETHVLEINFPDESFTGWMGGEPLHEGVFVANKDSYVPSSWGALCNREDALALFRAGGLRIYDGRGDYGTYLHAHADSAWEAWRGRRRRFSACLWLGAAGAARDAVPAAVASAPAPARAVVTLQTLEDRLDTSDKDIAAAPPGEERRRADLVQTLARRWRDQGRAVDALQLLEERTLKPLRLVQAGDLRLLVEERTDGIVPQSLRHASTDREFLATNTPPLFTLKLRQVETGDEIELRADSGWGRIDVDAGGDAVAWRWSSPDRPGLEALAVTAAARPDRGAHALRWQLEVDNPAAGWSLLNVVFPQVAVADLGPEGCVFFPRAPGEVEKGLWGRDFKHEGLYPEPWTTMQYVAAYPGRGEPGLYLATHDPGGSPKRIAINSRPRQRSVVFTYDHPAADMSRPGNGFATPGEVVWQLFRGDWFDAAMIYRDWVRREARWYTAPGPDGRADTPRWMRDLPIWVSRSGPFPDVVARTREFAAFLGVPVALHWYSWHEIPFDNDYPHYFPAKPGFAKHVAELQEAGVYVMPYINGRLWDTRDRGAEDFEFSQVALPAATKDENGKPYTEAYGSLEEDGSKVEFAVMCPATALWQERIRDICLRLFSEYGVDGVYIDQVAAMSPRLCMDPGHGHPLGGGAWWNEGYWQMLRSIRQAMPEQAMLTTECNSEPFAHVFDGYLSWTWQHDGQVPAFCAVYGGAIQMFGRQYGGNQAAKRMKLGQQLVFGEQLGWMWPDMMNEDQDTARFLRDTARLRWRLRRWFAAGEMARPPALDGDIPTLTENWEWAGSKDWFVTTPAVLTGAWSLPREKKTILLFVNVSEQPVSSGFAFEAAECGFGKNTLRRRRIAPDGDGEPEIVESTFTATLELKPLSTWAWEFGRTDSDYE